MPPLAMFILHILYSLAIYVLFLRKSNKTQIQQFKVGQVTMSSLHDTRSIGAVNPAAIEYLMMMNRAIWTWGKKCMPILNSKINELNNSVLFYLAVSLG